MRQRGPRLLRLAAGAAVCTALLSSVSVNPLSLLRSSVGPGHAFVLGGEGTSRKLARRPSLCIMKLRLDGKGPPPPKPPREKKMSEVEKKADAIVHAVVAVELLHWHGKLAGNLEMAFQKCVYAPVLPRLKRLTSRESGHEDFRMDKDQRIVARPSRVHDNTLEKQFTLGYAYTDVALRALNRRHNDMWFRLAQHMSRKELYMAETQAEDDPQAKDLVSFTQGWIKTPEAGAIHQYKNRCVGHNDAKQNIWILPVFVDHDRSAHAERQALLVLLEAAPIDPVNEGVKKDTTGCIRVFCSHTPCISCLSSMCQLTRAFEGASITVAFDTWKQTRRWMGLPEGEEQILRGDDRRSRMRDD